MNLATLSSKYQITLPKKLLDGYHLLPKNKVLIEKRRGGIFLRPLSRSITDTMAGSLYALIAKNKRGAPLPSIMKKTQKRVATYLSQDP